MAPRTMPTRKSVYILPNLLTTASLFIGFLCILWSVEGRFEWCALAILSSCLFDGLDGKVARLTGATSEFGVQLDSLADLVAFGVAPALTLYFWQLHQFNRLGLMACFLFIACAALRLARFNVQAKVADKKFFTGLPVPAAACTMASIILFSPYVPETLANGHMSWFLLGLTYILSFLMVSTVRFASFKEFGLVKAHPFSTMVTVILLFVLVASRPRVLGFVFFMGYLISGPVFTLFMLRRRSAMLRESRKELS